MRLAELFEGLFEDFKKPLLASNGKPSNLNPLQYSMVRSKTFKSWFGDWENDPKNASKIVDENNEPLVCYHGSSADFLIFDPTIGKNAQYFGDGFYFSNDSLDASHYASNNIGGNIMPVFLNIKNPFIEGLSKFNKGKPLNATQVRKDLIQKNYIKKGFDGIILKRGWQITFNPNQIKSAIGNSGTFKQDSNNINESLTFHKDKRKIPNYDAIDDEPEFFMVDVNTFKYSDALGGTAFGDIKNGIANINQMNSVPSEFRNTPDGSKYKRRGFFKGFLIELYHHGIKTIHLGLQSTDTRNMIKKLLNNKILINPRDHGGVSIDEHPKTFDINIKALEQL